jgi:hypothetical protein
MRRLLPVLACLSAPAAAEPASAAVRVEGLAVVGEGPFDPEDWVITVSAPCGTRVRLAAGSATLAPLIPHIAFHRLGPAPGGAGPGRDLHRIILGGRIRLAAAAAGCPLDLATATGAFIAEPAP